VLLGQLQVEGGASHQYLSDRSYRFSSAASANRHACSHESHHGPWANALREERIRGAAGYRCEKAGNRRICPLEPG